jgi:hypothetical protein
MTSQFRNDDPNRPEIEYEDNERALFEDEFGAEVEAEDDDLIIRRRGGHWYVRLAAAAMALIILAGMGYEALYPWLTGRSQPAPSFDMVLTGVTAPDNPGSGCATARRVNLGEALPPSRLLCLCGQLYPRGSEADYRVRLRGSTGASLGQWHYTNQPRGAFCHPLRLAAPLEEDRYLIEVFTDNGRRPVAFIRFTVRGNSQAFYEKIPGYPNDVFGRSASASSASDGFVSSCACDRKSLINWAI